MAENKVKAKLKIQLLANEVLVAEATDEKLWQKVLAAMQEENEIDALNSSPQNALKQTQDSSDSADKNIEEFAKSLKLDTKVVRGACSPSYEKPFLYLDEHCWEDFKNNTPSRGPNAVAGINLAATLLCLWFKYSNKETNPTQAQAKAVLDTIKVKERNATRSLRNCEWLQNRSGTILINPAKVSLAKSIVRAYCSQQPVENNG